MGKLDSLLQEKRCQQKILITVKFMRTNSMNTAYRHVTLPPELAKLVPRNHLMTETEWRNLGVQQSPGWIHYMFHTPEPHMLLFRRPKRN